jgi:hypothetical protein
MVHCAYSSDEPQAISHTADRIDSRTARLNSVLRQACRALGWRSVRIVPYTEVIQKFAKTGIISKYAVIRSSTHGTRLSMWAARPATRPPHPFFKLRAHPLDMLSPCLIFLDGGGPADPLVARERRYVFPRCPCLRVAHERFPEITREVMYNSSGDSNGCHRQYVSMLASGRRSLEF